ncbi:MAG: ABC transporter permease [Bacteroidia bacterium]
MRFALFIANKLTRNNNASFTKTVVRLATIAVSISVLVVILSYGILLGFKKEIRDKVSGYAGHITVSNFDLSQGNEHTELLIDDEIEKNIRAVENVKSVYPFLNKAGIIKSDSIIEGLIFKGIPSDYDLAFYKKHLLRGQLPSYTDSIDSYDILLSALTAQHLEVDTGSKLQLYFVNEGDVKRRRVTVKGIFNTGLQTFDKQFALCHLRMVQRVVSNDYLVAGGYEIKVDDFSDIEPTTKKIDNNISAVLRAVNIKNQYFTMFQWLEIVDSNVLIIIILMFIVAIINIITVLLILIIERIPMIGIFKAVGARNQSIMQIFSWQGLFILFGGLIIGNGLALGLGYLQEHYQLIKLSAETYYMDAVPFYLPIEVLLLINVATIVLAYLFTWLPSFVVARISPIRSIRFK